MKKTIALIALAILAVVGTALAGKQWSLFDEQPTQSELLSKSFDSKTGKITLVYRMTYIIDIDGGKLRLNNNGQEPRHFRDDELTSTVTISANNSFSNPAPGRYRRHRDPIYKPGPLPTIIPVPQPDQIIRVMPDGSWIDEATGKLPADGAYIFNEKID